MRIVAALLLLAGCAPQCGVQAGARSFIYTRHAPIALPGQSKKTTKVVRKEFNKSSAGRLKHSPAYLKQGGVVFTCTWIF